MTAGDKGKNKDPRDDGKGGGKDVGGVDTDTGAGKTPTGGGENKGRGA